MSRRFVPLIPTSLAVVLAVACGGDDETTPAPVVPGVGGQTPTPCLVPSRLTTDGRCLAPGVQDDGCPAGTLGLPDGSCQAAGIPPENCAQGFIPMAEGCEPELPSESCPAGQMALPGETTCRPVMSCGSGTWGDLPVDAATEYVDQSYSGGASDGSAQHPWTTIGDAIAAAPSGGLIAVAAGSYVGDLVITGKPVRLWGACPEQVEIVGTGDYAAVYLYSLAGPADVGGVAITGAGMGLIMMDVPDVFLAGVDATIEGTVVRDTQCEADRQTGGRGINAQDHAHTHTSTSLLLRHSVLERNRELSVALSASEGVVEGCRIVDTLANCVNEYGDGLIVTSFPHEASLTLSHTAVDSSARAGISNFGALASLGMSTLSCQAFDLDGEPWNGDEAVFEDRGEVTCGCPVADASCHAVSANLQPPQELDPPEE